MLKSSPKIPAIIIIAAIILFTTSCSDDDNGPSGEFATGVFVVNEGNFGQANGSITHISGDEVSQNIFGVSNNDRVLGDVVQSMTIHEDLAFVVVNNSNKVEVVNTNTFESQYTIENLSLPRYTAVYNGKAYITEWVDFSSPGRVVVFDLETRSIESTITTDFGAEFILEVNGLLYVTNNFTTTLSIINPETNTVSKTLDLGASASQMVVDDQGDIWALAGGTTANNDGKLFQIDTQLQSIDSQINLNASFSGKLAINNIGNLLYLINGQSIFSVDFGSSSASLTEVVNNPNVTGFYSVAVNPATNVIYAGDARGFQGAGNVYTYRADGSPVDTITSGIGPTNFVFK